MATRIGTRARASLVVEIDILSNGNARLKTLASDSGHLFLRDDSADNHWTGQGDFQTELDPERVVEICAEQGFAVKRVNVATPWNQRELQDRVFELLEAGQVELMFIRPEPKPTEPEPDLEDKITEVILVVPTPVDEDSENEKPASSETSANDPAGDVIPEGWGKMKPIPDGCVFFQRVKDLEGRKGLYAIGKGKGPAAKAIEIWGEIDVMGAPVPGWIEDAREAKLMTLEEAKAAFERYHQWRNRAIYNTPIYLTGFTNAIPKPEE